MTCDDERWEKVSQLMERDLAQPFGVDSGLPSEPWTWQDCLNPWLVILFICYWGPWVGLFVWLICVAVRSWTG